MASDEFQIFIADQLAELKGLCMKRMFGAVGMYLDEARLFFKTSESTREKRHNRTGFGGEGLEL